VRTIVLLPGIMGSRLVLDGREVWPPTPTELAFGYGRAAELASPRVRVGDLIRSLACFPIYQSLIDQLGKWDIPEAPRLGRNGQLLCWPYDWRVDIRSSAAKLAADLQRLVSQHADVEITLLAHSMGGLVSRCALEVDQDSVPTGWRANVRLLITMGTPHRGAPIALTYALGLAGMLGLDKSDVKKLAATAGFPSTYQLIPPGDAFGFWSRQGGAVPLQPVDVLDPNVFGLGPENARAAVELHRALAAGTPPCRYFSFVGRELETAIRGDLVEGPTLEPVKGDDGGDGTVPVWSGAFAGAQFQLDGDSHIRTFRNASLLATLAELLEVAPELRAAAAPPPPWITLSLPRHVFAPGETVRASVQTHAYAIADLELAIVPVDDAGRATGAAVETLPLGSVRAGASLRVDVTLPSAPGLYMLAPRSASGELPDESVHFAVRARTEEPR
jgi:pimeloyl-ACP methyl ester carboxylesterase